MTHFVLVHGTTQSPAGWDRLAAELRGRGHGVTTIDLPGDQPEWAPADYARHAAAPGYRAGPHRRRPLPHVSRPQELAGLLTSLPDTDP